MKHQPTTMALTSAPLQCDSENPTTQLRPSSTGMQSINEESDLFKSSGGAPEECLQLRKGCAGDPGASTLGFRVMQDACHNSVGMKDRGCTVQIYVDGPAAPFEFERVCLRAECELRRITVQESLCFFGFLGPPKFGFRLNPSWLRVVLCH